MPGGAASRWAASPPACRSEAVAVGEPVEGLVREPELGLDGAGIQAAVAWPWVVLLLGAADLAKLAGGGRGPERVPQQSRVPAPGPGSAA